MPVYLLGSERLRGCKYGFSATMDGVYECLDAARRFCVDYALLDVIEAGTTRHEADIKRLGRRSGFHLGREQFEWVPEILKIFKDYKMGLELQGTVEQGTLDFDVCGCTTIPDEVTLTKEMVAKIDNPVDTKRMAKKSTPSPVTDHLSNLPAQVKAAPAKASLAPIELIPAQFEGHDVQFFLRDGEPWWPAPGPCDVLGIERSREAVERLDEDEKGAFSIRTLGGVQETWCINEAGLYSLILGSRKPKAKAFKRWITHEVLPAIRKTGRYELTQARVIAHTRHDMQVQNSKQVATFQDLKGGKKEIIRWFVRSSKYISDLYPFEWMAKAQAMGMSSRYQKSGRETMRVLEPAKASGVSLSDDCLTHGVTEDKSLEIGKESVTLFQKMLDAGLKPPELRHSPLDKVSA